MKKLILLIIFAGSLFAQKAELSMNVDDAHYYIGDRIKISINIKSSAQQMFILPDTKELIKDLLILDVSADEKIKRDLKTTTLNIEAVGLDTGFVHIPVMPVISTDSTGFGRPDTLFTPEKYIYIYSILDSSAAPVAMRAPLPLGLMTWWEYLITIVLILIAGVLLYLGLRYRSRKKDKVEDVWESPKEKAEHYLEELEKKHYPDKEQWKKFYLELTYIAREYFENIYFVHLKELTTTDLIPALKENVPIEYQDKLQELFQYADLVKFAKGVADHEQCDIHLGLVKEIVENDNATVTPDAMADRKEGNEEESVDQST